MRGQRAGRLKARRLLIRFNPCASIHRHKITCDSDPPFAYFFTVIHDTVFNHPPIGHPPLKYSQRPSEISIAAVNYAANMIRRSGGAIAKGWLQCARSLSE